MFKDRVALSFKGFHPSQNTRDLLDQLLSEIITEGPSFSKIKAHIIQEGEKDHVIYKGVIEMSSNAGRFFTKANSTQIVDLSHKLLKRTRKQFSKWKEKRFGDRKKIHHAEIAIPELEDVS